MSASPRVSPPKPPAPATPGAERAPERAAANVAWDEESAIHFFEAFASLEPATNVDVDDSDEPSRVVPGAVPEPRAIALNDEPPSEQRPLALPAQRMNSIPPGEGFEPELEALQELLEGDASGPASDAAPPSEEDVGRLFSEYQRYVAKIGGRILGTGTEVDDLVQDVFLAALRDVHKLRDRTRLKPWLATITTRMATRRRARRGLQKSQLAGSEGLVEVPCSRPSPEFRAEAQSSVQRLLKLPAELRKPWLLKHVEGASLQHIAEVCDCSCSTAQRRIRLASLRILGTAR
jgi:RNA polymerase sigma-70 factor, ECF subfamily